MNNAKTAAMMYIAGGAFFLISGLLGGKLIFLILGAVVIVVGLQKLRSARDG